MKYSYYVNTVVQLPEGKYIPVKKSGTTSISKNVHTEQDIIEVLIDKGIIDYRSYEILELRKL